MTAQRDPVWWDSYKAQVVATANRIGIEMAGCGIEAFRLLVAANDVAFGVFQDRLEPDGVGTILIKGHQMLREVVADNAARALSLTAIPCRSAEEAEALRRVIGENDVRH